MALVSFSIGGDEMAWLDLDEVQYAVTRGTRKGRRILIALKRGDQLWAIDTPEARAALSHLPKEEPPE